MTRHPIGLSALHQALVGAALGLSAVLTAQAAPVRADVTGTSYACVSLSGEGTRCGAEWFVPLGNSIVSPASHVFSSNAFASGQFSSGPPGSPVFPGSTQAQTTLSAVASTGVVSARADARANYDGPQHPNPAAPIYHAWANTAVTGRWFDTLTVAGGSLGSSVLVRMTVSLEDTISGGPNGPNGGRWAEANAGLYAQTGRDTESGRPSYVGTTLRDLENAPASSRTAELEFWVEVGESFEIYGVLGIVARVDITDADGFSSQWADVEASHTMRGFFEIMNPVAGQTISSDSGWDYRFNGGPTTPGNTVPEPLTPGLVVMALAGMAASRRNRARHSVARRAPC